MLVIDPLNCSDRLANLMRREDIKALRVRLELGQVLVLFDTLLVLLQLEADDTTSTITHAENAARVVEGHS